MVAFAGALSPSHQIDSHGGPRILNERATAPQTISAGCTRLLECGFNSNFPNQPIPVGIAHVVFHRLLRHLKSRATGVYGFRASLANGKLDGDGRRRVTSLQVADRLDWKEIEPVREQSCQPPPCDLR